MSLFPDRDMILSTERYCLLNSYNTNFSKIFLSQNADYVNVSLLLNKPQFWPQSYQLILMSLCSQSLYESLLCKYCRSKWPRGLKRRSAAARLPHRRHGCLSGVSVVCCQSSLWRADQSCRGDLLTGLRRCAWSRNLKEALVHWGPVAPKRNKETKLCK